MTQGLAGRRAPLFPFAAERAAARYGVAIVRSQHQALRRAFELHGARIDQFGDDWSPGPVLQAFGVFAREILPDDPATDVGRYGRIVQQHVRGETRRFLQLPTLLAVDVDEVLRRRWAVEAASRIVLVAEADRTRVARVVLQAHAEGWPRRRLRDELRKAGAQSRRQAQLWARDQVATINGLASEQEHARIGVTHYRWRTSRDERVRRLHDHREGVVFRWDRPPRETSDDGHPGQPINCRCTAEPVFADELQAALAESGAYDPASPTIRPR